MHEVKFLVTVLVVVTLSLNLAVYTGVWISPDSQALGSVSQCDN